MGGTSSDLMERVLSAVIYLYGVITRRDFFDASVLCLQSIFEESKVSIVSASSSTGRLELLVSSEVVDCVHATCESQAIFDVLQGDCLDSASTIESLTVNGQQFAVTDQRMIYGDGAQPIMVLFHNASAAECDEEQRGLLAYVLDHIEMVYLRVSERDVLRNDLDVKEARLEAIQRFTDRLGTLDVDVLISQLLEVCMYLTEAQVGSVRLRGIVETEAEWGLPGMVLDSLKTEDGTPILEHVVETRTGGVFDDLETFPDLEGLPVFKVTSLLCVPIMADDRCLGTIDLVMGGGATRGFSERDLLAIKEISGLAGIAIENSVLHHESLEKQRIEEGLKIAQTIQTGMQPTSSLNWPGHDCAWLNQSCDETGGDYLDFISMSDDRVAIAIGDVSGHGIGAAMLMASGRANLRALVSVKDDLKDIVCRMNNLMEPDMDVARFMTFFVACLDFESGELSYVNAGHDCPQHYSRKADKVVEFESSGLPIGIQADWDYDPAYKVAVEPGDALLLATDGLFETVNEAGERYGKDRMGEILRQNIDRPSAEIVDCIVQDVHSFSNGMSAADDRTLIVIKKSL